MRAALLVPLLAACAPERDCAQTLWYVDDGSAGEVAVLGDWTGWRPEPLQRFAEGAWTLRLDLPEGDHAYAFEVDGARTLDPYQPLLHTHPVSGEERSLLRVPACDSPALEVVDLEASAAGALSAELTFLRLPGGPRLDPESVTAAVGGAPARVEATPGSGALSVTARDLPPGKHHLTLSAADRGGASTTLDVPFWVEDRPFSWGDGLVYQVMIDRFATAEGGLPPVDPAQAGARQGGTLAGVRAQLDAGYFEALGARVLWLSPVGPNPDGAWPGSDGNHYESYHGYWPIARAGVDERLGTAEELADLVTAAHARGIRVLVDVVPNHVHIEHPWWAQQGDWFQGEGDCVCGTADCGWAEHIETCWFTDYLPDLDWTEPAVAAAVTADLEATARAFDLDGLRVDAVPMMPRAAVRHIAWTAHEALEQGGPTRFFLLGETFTGPGDVGTIRKNLGPHGLDGQFDFPVMWALRGFVAWGTLDAADLEATLRASHAAWAGSGAVMSPFVGNHDVSRFLSEAAGHRTDAPWDDPPPQPTDPTPYDQLVLAQAIALTLPGMPVIWQGDELGLAGATDPDCRRTLPFGADRSELQAATLERIQRIGRARACSRALQRGVRVPIAAEGPVYAHLRDALDGRPALLVVNASDAPRSVDLRLPPSADGAFIDVIAGGPAVTPSAETLALPAWTARLYLPENSDCIEEMP